MYSILSLGHGGRYGHEFLEFEVKCNGVLTYLNQSRYKREAKIFRKVQLSAEVLAIIQDMIEMSGLSQVTRNIENGWLSEVNDASTSAGIQEIEVLTSKRHYFFALPRQLDPTDEKLRKLYELTDKLNEFLIFLVQTHFKASPFG